MHSTPEASEKRTIVERNGALGHIRLNRPKALNSLTLDMVRDIDEAMDRFESDHDIAVVLISGEGERGFCAGGDIRAVYDAGRAGSAAPIDFWAEEYRLNARIARYPKAYVAFMDGIVMGGGAGLTVHGSHRIVTERTRFAMPETGIGFYPDVGGSWFLTRGPGELGTYIALTGEILGAGDVILAGLADHHVPSECFADLTDELAGLSQCGAAEVGAAIATFVTEPVPCTLALVRDEIDRLFRFDTIEEIIAALEEESSDFALKTLETLHRKSPLSLKVTLRLLRFGTSSASLEECLEREFSALTGVMKSHDFYEGVRAAVIDKDRNPKWQPASLDVVTEADMEPYFTPSPQPLFSES
ncbi:enoyl-CoA hydratase [Pararhizobium capsulatum DSM 1112]|uniref:3-hydroxyisobutyryl-CoA hydrolase n=1 Tax=Pararhizobium capsulatum DSM 1112 TaxID=1121113 RepID=A0ABU0BW90_9HYPH|nr:enoyl-CoA hydratase/isomerase family protein [Pararhizobium capsulatum]MDQ0322526.1 enoyl-CoA hydratase [Pararhizobium capsulatum DSM 1112]